jgi:Ca-activated chloride channel family protein
MFTYRLNWILVAIIMWEIIFWGLYYTVFKTIGASDHKAGIDQLMFKSPKVLNLLFVIIPITLLYLINVIRHNKLVNSMTDKTVKAFMKPVSTFSSFMKYFLFRNAIGLLIIALAMPIYGKKKISGTSESLELVICLDISNSMNVRDISSEDSRLEISKRALIQLINKLHGEKIGLCLFANNAFVHLPLTTDYAAAKLFISDIETNMISSQGTNINDALTIATDMFSNEKTTKGIILVTDGENHEQNPAEVLKKIKENNIQLSVLGIGTKKGGLVPKNPHRPEAGYKTDPLGKTVVSKLNPSFIKKIAKLGGGKASISSSEFPNLSALLTQINQMKRTKIDTLDFEVKEERYQIPLILSFVFWMFYLLWSRRYLNFLDKFIDK